MVDNTSVEIIPSNNGIIIKKDEKPIGFIYDDGTIEMWSSKKRKKSASELEDNANTLRALKPIYMEALEKLSGWSWDENNRRLLSGTKMFPNQIISPNAHVTWGFNDSMLEAYKNVIEFVYMVDEDAMEKLVPNIDDKEEYNRPDNAAIDLEVRDILSNFPNRGQPMIVDKAIFDSLADESTALISLCRMLTYHLNSVNKLENVIKSFKDIDPEIAEAIAIVTKSKRTLGPIVNKYHSSLEKLHGIQSRAVNPG